MGHEQHLRHGHRLNFMIFSLLFLIVSSWIQQGFVTEGRKTLKQNGSDEQLVISKGETSMGSGPPDCEGKCSSSCGLCEAIQVSTPPQKKMNTSISAYGKADESSNSDYKPIIWKCECAN